MYKRILKLPLAIVVFLCCLVGQAAAQVNGPYQNTTAANINGSSTCWAGKVTRIINVPTQDVFEIADLNVGFLATHAWRGDIAVRLTSPAGTTVDIIQSDSNNEVNLNVLLDDSAGNQIYTFPHTTNDGIVAPPYENTVRPSSALSAFNGEIGAGDWTLDICDTYPWADDGQFKSAHLYFTAAPPPAAADLSVALSATDTTPSEGSNVTLTFRVDHIGSVAATGVTVDITLPSGLSYVSDNSGGSYNSSTGVWTIPSALQQNSASMEITAYVNLTGSYTVVSEVATSGQADPDSTPGNSNTSEDDYISLTLVPFTPSTPLLSCPAAPLVLDWDTETWATGSMNNTYTVSGKTISVSVTDANSALFSDPAVNGQTPSKAALFTGGLTPSESSIHFLANQPNISGTVDITLALGTFGLGVEKVQFTLFDVDYGANQFHDRIIITGSLNGAGVSPVLYTNPNNSASGNVATGTGAAGSTSGSGNLTIEFNAPVDTVVVQYGNGSNAPSNPGNQGIGLHDISFCPKLLAELSAHKTVAVFDPNSEGLYAVPGQDVIYTIEFTNQGDGPSDTDSLVMIDKIPPEIKFYNGDIDDGGPQTTAITGTDNGSGLTFNYASDVRYSNLAVRPLNFAACTYTPSAGYDPNVRYVCVNPKGAMAAGTPNPSYQIKFRARIL